MTNPPFPKLLLIGANGQLGRCLQGALTRERISFIPVSRADFNLEKPDAFEQMLERHHPSLVINAAAYTQVDQAESEPNICAQINFRAVQIIGQACAQHNIPLIHFSTDYVFDGNKTSAYLEADRTAPINQYGYSKLKGEQALLHTQGLRCLILRVSWLFSEYGQNFVKTMLTLGKSRSELSVVDDQIGAPTSAHHIADFSLQEAKKLISDSSYNPQIYHLQSEPQVSWFAFAERIFSEAVSLGLLPKAPTLTPVPSTAFPTAAARPKMSKLNTEKGFPVYHWQESLSYVLKQLKANN